MDRLVLVVGSPPAGELTTALSAALRRRGLRVHAVACWAEPWLLLGQWSFDAVVLLPSADEAAPTARERAALAQLCRGPLARLDGAGPTAGPRWSDPRAGGAPGGREWCVLPGDPAAAAAALCARLDAAVTAPGTLQIGSLQLDLPAERAWVRGRALALSRTQLRVLGALASRPGQCIERAILHRLVDLALQPGAVSRVRALDMQIVRLRRALDAAGAHDLRIDTHYGWGYGLSRRAAS